MKTESENNNITSNDDANSTYAGSLKKLNVRADKLNPLYGYKIKAFVA